MSISLRGRVRGLQRLPSLKYYYVLKWESRFTLGLTLPKIRIISKNASNKGCLEFSFVQKIQWVHMFTSHRSEAKGSEDYHL